MAEKIVTDLTDRKFGRWLVIGPAESKTYLVTKRGRKTPLTMRYWMCRCSCQLKTERPVREQCLLRRLSTGCECVMRERQLEAVVTHGLSKTSEFWTWQGIIQRCLNPRYHQWAAYGGRGITICARWIEAFEYFLIDMGPKPSSLHSIDRWPDKNGHYEPGNCRWATNQQQQRNLRSNHLIEYGGRKLTLVEWSEVTGIDYHVLSGRINRMKWPIEKALTKSVKEYKARTA